MIANADRDDILISQLYLSRFGNVSMGYSDGLTLKDIKLMSGQIEKWEKEIRTGEVKLEESKLKSLFRGLGKLFGSR